MTTVHVLHSAFEQTRGVLGRYPEPGECYVFPFESVRHRAMHMLGVRRPLRVGWYVDNSLVTEEVLRPMIGVGVYKADTVIETHPDSDLPGTVDEVVA